MQLAMVGCSGNEKAMFSPCCVVVGILIGERQGVDSSYNFTSYPTCGLAQQQAELDWTELSCCPKGLKMIDNLATCPPS
jgi:hypothetical protein